METNGNDLNHLARSYFLEQGKSIMNLHGILNSNVFSHHFRKWSSIVLEVILYLLFLVIFVLVIVTPTKPDFYFPIDEYNRVGISYQNRDFEMLMIILKFVVILISLPILFFAILLGRNRKKNTLIYEAFTEVEKMKEGFDRAVKELKL